MLLVLLYKGSKVSGSPHKNTTEQLFDILEGMEYFWRLLKQDNKTQNKKRKWL